MNVVNGHPPNYQAICAAFPAHPRTAIFCYGNTIFNPAGSLVPQHLFVHEGVHAEQQRQVGPESWWNQYIADTQFRLNQEVEAYRAQYRSLNRASRRQIIDRLAKDLSGPMYGGIVSFARAKALIANP